MSKYLFKRIYIEITNICNLSCDFCPTTKRKAETMDLGKFKHVISEIKNYTKYIYLHVKGEPLMHPFLDEILDICKTNDLYVNITTNGTLLNYKKELLIKDNRIRLINVSMHSFDKNADLTSVFEAVEYINKSSQTLISLRYWDTAQKELCGRFTLKDRIFISRESKFNWPSLKENIISEKGTCLALTQQLAILVDGTIVPCCLDNDGDIALGNIFDSTLSEILNTTEVKVIKENFKKNKLVCELCKRCDFARRFTK